MSSSVMDSNSGAPLLEAEDQGNTKEVIYDAILSGDFSLVNGLLGEAVQPPAHHLEWLRDLCVDGQPLLHYLIGKPVSSGSEEQLYRFVKTCVVEAGVNVDQLGNTSHLTGCTALVGAIQEGNDALAKSLIRWGGGATSVNFRDGQGRSAANTSILKLNLEMLKFLVDHGGAVLKSTSEELAGVNGTHPPLHTAIDRRCRQIAAYLISKNLVDVSEVAVYSMETLEADSPSLSLFHEIPSSTGSEASGTEVSVGCSPIGRAILSQDYDVVELLLSSNATLNGFRELDFCLRKGHSKLVSMLLRRRFSDETVRDHRIDAELALSCFPCRTFPPGEAIRNKFMRVLISKYTSWARTGIPFIARYNTTAEAVDVEDALKRLTKTYKVSDYSILHMAVASGDLALVKTVVDKGAELNCLTGARGNLQCSPLHLAIMMTGKAALAEYLVEQGSDLELEGCVTHPNSPIGFTHVVRDRMRDFADPQQRFGKFNALELLLQLGLGDDRTMEKMLASSGRVSFHGADELRLAVSGGNMGFIKKCLAPPGAIRPEDLQWIHVWGAEEEEEGVRREPLFQHLVNNINHYLTSYNVFTIDRVGRTLAEFLQDLISRGYDCNAVGDGGESQIFAVLQVVVYFGGEDTLLKTFLNSGGNHHQLEINGVRNKRGESPVGFLLREWNSQCSQDLPCRRTPAWQPDVFKMLKLLLLHGADGSGLEIGAETKYHWGYGDLIKLLCSAGARVKAEFFEDPLCGWGGRPANREILLGEVEELREWVSTEGNNMRLDLYLLCRAAIRGSVRRVGDLQKLDSLLPPSLKGYLEMKEELKEEKELEK